jgi:hypothetical protein
MPVYVFDQSPVWLAKLRNLSRLGSTNYFGTLRVTQTAGWIPFAVELIGYQIDMRLFFVGDFAADWVFATIQSASNLQALGRRCPAIRRMTVS